jgi:hypothetical protein
MQSTMHLYPIDGAAHDVANDATPWSYRDANWAQVIVGVDPDPANASLIEATGRSATTTHCTRIRPGGAYVNIMMDEGQERVRATYRDNYPRLARIKATYDPERAGPRRDRSTMRCRAKSKEPRGHRG